MKNLIALILILLSTVVMAQDTVWRDKDGNPVPNTDAMKSINGFGGWLVVTPDKDWEEKWNTPSENTPHFNEAKDVSYGQELTVLIFFTNPQADDKGHMNITCDIKVMRPDKSYSIDASEVNCANWKVPPEQYKYNVLLTRAVIKYVGEPGDLPGVWKVQVNLNDKNAGIEITLKTEFNLIDKPANKSKRLEGKSATGV